MGKCPRECHQVRYCGWAPWSTFGECSATCGIAVKSRSRILKSFNHPLDLRQHAQEASEFETLGSDDSGRTVEIAAKYAQLDSWFQRLEHRHTQELVVSWAG